VTPVHDIDRLVGAITDEDHFRGDPDAPVTLVEYGEFECPHCGRAYHAIKELLEADGDVRFVFRHFARDDVHPFSERSAQAAEAAGAQGRFWEMHDVLFESQHQLEHNDLELHAERLGLDVDRFRREMRDQLYMPTVRAQLDSGLASGVTETPTFFVDGVKYTGSYSTQGLRVATRSLRRPA
jgi:protein-disulfide isomerase